MKKIFRAVCCVGAVCLLLLPSACGEDARRQRDAEISVVDESAYFAKEAYALPWNRIDILCAAPDGERLYYGQPDGVHVWTEQAGGRLHAAAPAPPDDGARQYRLLGMAAGADGSLWLLERIDTLRTDDNAIELAESRLFLRALDSAGNETARLTPELPLPESMPPLTDCLAVDNSGRLYLLSAADTVHILDPATGGSRPLESESPLQALLRLHDGRVGAIAGDSFREINGQNARWGESYPLPRGAGRPDAGTSYDLLYQKDGALYGHDLGSGQEVLLLDWLNCDINGARIHDIRQLSADSFLCFSQFAQASGTEQAFLRLRRADESERPEKTVLRLAAVLTGVGGVEQVVQAFNSSDPHCRIELVNYFDFNAGITPDQARQKFNTELIAGNIPDLLILDDMPMARYIALGMLTDLAPYLEADGQLTREDIMPNVLAALEQDGCLYTLPTSFSISTAAGLSRVVGKEAGWTQAEFLSLLAQSPNVRQPIALTDRSGFLSILTEAGMSRYLDWESGVCRFDSPEYVALLELAATLPAEIDWQDPDMPEWGALLLRSGEALLSQEDITSFESIAKLEAMCNEPVTLKGFPADDGFGSSLQLHNCLAITESCADKEAAWRFLRGQLGAAFQITPGNVRAFPTNQEAFAQKYAQEMSRVTDETWHADPETMVTVVPVTQRQAGQIEALINATTMLESTEEAVLDIIQEEAAAFFAGQNTAAEAAAIIQSRVSVYVNEQK